MHELTSSFPGVVLNESELRADLPNGSQIRLYGADNFNRMRGIGLDGAILDEYADFDPRAWPEVIRPALADRRGWAVFIGTPRGHNDFYDQWVKSQKAENRDEWFSLMLKASQSGIVPAAELADLRKDLTDDQYAQELECSFDAAVLGAYYAKDIALAEQEGRICSVPHDVAAKVETWWDIGVGDPTAIWFVQRAGKELHVIDYYEASGVGIDHYAAILAQKAQPRSAGGLGYVYGEHVVPHDAKVKEWGNAGRSRLDVMATLGLRAVVSPMHNVEDGINAVRLLLPKCWFDAKRCEFGVRALRGYKTEYDDKRKVLKNNPLHDWTSHAADAFRYGAMHRPVGGDFWKRKTSEVQITVPIV